jgi:RHS repeat-associated protein
VVVACAAIEELVEYDAHVHAHAGPANGVANGPHYGAVRVEYDVASALINYEEYHPFGTSAYRAVDSTIEVSPKRYRYAAAERDEETGLDHMGLRYYAPWLGRWTSADPIGLGDGVNRYAYVHGNPVSMRDPGGTAASVPSEQEQAARVQREKAQVEPSPPDLQAEAEANEAAKQAQRASELGEQFRSAETPQEKAVLSFALMRELLDIDLSPLEKTVEASWVREASSDVVPTLFGRSIAINLTPDVLEAAFSIPAGARGEAPLPIGELGTLAHEATHAFLLTDPEGRQVLADAASYYAFTNAAQEAAAEYVEHRVASLLESHFDLSLAEQGIAQGSEYGLGVAEQKVGAVTRRIDNIGARKNFGYVDLGGRQVPVRKPIEPRLAEFLDRTVLGKLPQALDSVRSRADEIQRRLATQR